MADHPVFDRETLLDALVNVVPLAILAFFLAVFVVRNPWADHAPLEGVVQLLLVATPLGLLAYLTYETAKRL